MQPNDYLIVKHFNKTRAQIYVWALLMSSQLHWHAQMKSLVDTYVPMGTNNNNAVAMNNQVIRGHRIIFCDEEFPLKVGCRKNIFISLSYVKKGL